MLKKAIMLKKNKFTRLRKAQEKKRSVKNCKQINGSRRNGTVIEEVKHSISHVFLLCNTCLFCVWTDALALCRNVSNINPISLDGFYLDLQIMLLEIILLFSLVSLCCLLSERCIETPMCNLPAKIEDSPKDAIKLCWEIPVLAITVHFH